MKLLSLKREAIGLYLEKGRLDYVCMRKNIFGIFPKSPAPGMEPSGTMRGNEYSPLKMFLEGIPENRRSHIYLALPRSLFFLREVQLPPMLMEEALLSIRNNLTVYCHLPLEEINYDVHLTRSSDKGINALLFYALSKEIDRFLKIFDEAGKRHLLKGLFPASFGVYAWLRVQGYERVLALIIPSQEGVHEMALYRPEGFVYSASWPVTDGRKDTLHMAAGAGIDNYIKEDEVYSLDGKGSPVLPLPETNKLGKMPAITENLGVGAVSCAFFRKQHISLDGRPSKPKLFRAWMAFLPLCLFLIFVMGLLTWRSYEYNAMKSSELASLEKEIRDTEKKINPLEAKLKVLEDSRQVFNDIENYVKSKPKLYKALNEIAQFLPEGTWFSSLTYERGRLTLRGLTNDALEVQKALRKSRSFGQAKLVGSVSRARSGEERFTLSIQLKEQENSPTRTRKNPIPKLRMKTP